MGVYINMDFKKLLAESTFEIVPKQEENNHSKKSKKPHEADTYATILASYANFTIADNTGKDSPFETLASQMTNVTVNGLVKKLVMREGYGPRPTPSDTVKINYNAYVEYEALPFDSTYARRQSCSFPIRDAGVIPGLLIAVCSMKLCEKAQFLIASELAYRNGGLNRVPPDATVLFDIELADISITAEQLAADAFVNGGAAHAFAKVYEECVQLSEQAKRQFRLLNVKNAAREYQGIIRRLENAVLSDDADQVKYDELLVRLYRNLLVCYTHLKEPRRGCSVVNRILELTKNGNVRTPAKVWYNSAKCLQMLGEYRQAETRFTKALQMEPDNETIMEQFNLMLKEEREYLLQEKILAAALLKGGVN